MSDFAALHDPVKFLAGHPQVARRLSGRKKLAAIVLKFAARAANTDETHILARAVTSVALLATEPLGRRSGASMIFIGLNEQEASAPQYPDR
jgi:hypothetical protein